MSQPSVFFLQVNEVTSLLKLASNDRHSFGKLKGHPPAACSPSVPRRSLGFGLFLFGLSYMGCYTVPVTAGCI